MNAREWSLRIAELARREQSALADLLLAVADVEGQIREGKLCITTVSELAKVMTEENRAEVLPMFFGLSRQEAKQLAARRDSRMSSRTPPMSRF